MGSMHHLNTNDHMSVGNHLSGFGCDGRSNLQSAQASQPVTTSVPLPVEPAACPPDDTNLKMYLDAMPSGLCRV